MITIKICEYECQFNRVKDIDEQWINQQINRRRDCGATIFVRVIIQQGAINIGLATPNCPGGGGGIQRTLQPQEKAVVDLWHERGLDNLDFTGGNLIAFLKQMENLF